jgi:hypothetical protein
MALILGDLGKKGERSIEVSYYFSVNRDKPGMVLQALEGWEIGTMAVM